MLFIDQLLIAKIYILVACWSRWRRIQKKICLYKMDEFVRDFFFLRLHSWARMFFQRDGRHSHGFSGCVISKEISCVQLSSEKAQNPTHLTFISRVRLRGNPFCIYKYKSWRIPQSAHLLPSTSADFCNFMELSSNYRAQPPLPTKARKKYNILAV